MSADFLFGGGEPRMGFSEQCQVREGARKQTKLNLTDAAESSRVDRREREHFVSYAACLSKVMTDSVIILRRKPFSPECRVSLQHLAGVD